MELPLAEGLASTALGFIQTEQGLGAANIPGQEHQVFPLFSGQSLVAISVAIK